MKRVITIFAAMFFIISLTCGFNVTAKQRVIYKNHSAAKNTAEASKVKASRGVSYTVLKNAKGERIFYSKRAVVLTYHHISSQTLGDITVTPERFESDIKMLMDKGFNIISLEHMINAMNGNAVMPDNAVVITFDDGIESFYKYAYPVLLKYNLPATNFVITSRNEAYKPSDKDMNSLSPAEISEMYNSGLIGIESHTNNSHEKVYINSSLKMGPKLTNKIYNKETRTYETDEEYEKRVADDLNKSRELIFKYTGHYSNVLCFPYGVYTKKVMDIAKQCGFDYFVTTIEGYNSENSGKNKILRIRSGDEKLDTDKLFNNIVDVANNRKAH